jgi:hypothetical protein
MNLLDRVAFTGGAICFLGHAVRLREPAKFDMPLN